MGSEMAKRPVRPKPDPAPTTPDAVEIAMEAEAKDTAPDSPARRLLVDQGRLIRWQIASERAGFALKALTGLAGLALAATLGVLIWQASRAHALIIEPFSVPPSLAQEGMIGQVVASRLLDRMSTMQSQVSSQRAPSSFARTWDGDVRIEIPETGVTIAELNRELRGWLGHETHITGEVALHGGAAALTVRVAAQPGVTARGAEAELEGLIDAAGDAAFARAEPYRYAIWQRQHGDPLVGAAIFGRLARAGPPAERAWGFSGLANAALDTEGVATSIRYSRAAQAIAPWMMLPPTNIAFNELQMGHPAAARAAAAQALANDTPRADVRDRRVTRLRAEVITALADADLPKALAAASGIVAAGSQGANTNMVGVLVRVHLAQHDIAAARADLARPDPSAGARTTVARAYDAVLMRLKVRVAEGDVTAALAAAAEAEALAARYPALRDRIVVEVGPQVALALAGGADPAAARARIAAAPLDSYDSLIVRGRIAALAGDAASADAWFARAATADPKGAWAESAWAQALLARGDLAGALARARVAERRAPRFADPPEIAGEALLAKGDAKGAAAKFTEAAKLAPRWGRLHLKWGEALAKLGRTDEARAKWRAAATMDLSPADRAALRAHGA